MQHTNDSTDRPATTDFLQQLAEAYQILTRLAPRHPEERGFLRSALVLVDAIGLFHVHRTSGDGYELPAEREDLANAVLEASLDGQPDMVEDAVCRYRMGEARRFIANMGARTEGEQRGRWLLAALVEYIERAQEAELDVDEHWAALDFFRAGMDAREEG
ncbi:MAG: hypothetical protein GY719_03685 [bacterium]|nr:hypothetical protein [bacterium]